MVSIRWRAFLAIAAVFLFGSALLYDASTVFIQGQFGRIEVSDTEQSTERAVDVLNNRVTNLANLSSSWSNWDETYQFVVNHNQAFVAANLPNASIAHLGINFMLFYDTAGHLVYAKGITDADGDLAVPTALLSKFGPSSQLMSRTATEDYKGYLLINDEPLYFAAQPILTSDGMGPVHGTLVFAKYLTNTDISKLAALTRLNLNFYTLPGNVPDDVTPILSQLSAKQPTVKPLNDTEIAGYELIDDPAGNPILVTRVLGTRQSFIEAQQSLMYFLAAIAIVTLCSITLTIYITNLVLERDETIRLKNEFFSIASHELRTPLTAIRGNVRLLQEHYGPKQDKAFQELTADIAESSMRLIRMVSNFLDAARFEHGNVPLTLSAVSLHDISLAVVNELQGVARDKHIYIHNEVRDDLPLVYADRDRVTQVVYNLIGNAAKFTSEGGVTVSAEVQGEMVKVSVTDTGRGITPEGQHALFHKFQQVKAGDSKNGSGLGLYIAKMLVELMDGQIRLEKSAENVGTTISFTLPVATKDQIAASMAKLS